MCRRRKLEIFHSSGRDPISKKKAQLSSTAENIGTRTQFQEKPSPSESSTHTDNNLRNIPFNDLLKSHVPAVDFQWPLWTLRAARGRSLSSLRHHIFPVHAVIERISNVFICRFIQPFSRLYDTFHSLSLRSETIRREIEDFETLKVCKEAASNQENWILPFAHSSRRQNWS